MSNEKYTYTDAFEELQSIVSEIEQGGISIDALSEKVRRATQLISVCKAKLTATEEEVNNILANLTTDVDAKAPTEGDE